MVSIRVYRWPKSLYHANQSYHHTFYDDTNHFKVYGLILEINYWVQNRRRPRQGTLPIAEP